MTELTHNEIESLKILGKFADILEKLKDKDVSKTLKEGALENLKKTEELSKEISKTTQENKKTLNETQLLLNENKVTLEKLTEAQLKLKNDKAEFKEMQSEFSSYSKGRTAELDQRERLVNAMLTDAENARKKADSSASKHEKLNAELEEKLNKIKDFAA